MPTTTRMNPSPPVPPPPPEILELREEIVASPAPPSRLALLLRDHTLQFFFALTLIVNLALVVYLVLRFDALPDPLPLHFDASGLADRIEAKTGIFGLPLIGFIVLVLNSILGISVQRRERAAAILLITGALFVQILLWFAVSRIIGGLV